MSPALAGGFFTAEPPGKPSAHDSFDIGNWHSSLRGVELLLCAALPEVSRIMHIPLRIPGAQGKVGRKQPWWYDSLWIFGVWSFSNKHALNFFFFFFFCNRKLSNDLCDKKQKTKPTNFKKLHLPVFKTLLFKRYFLTKRKGKSNIGRNYLQSIPDLRNSSRMYKEHLYLNNKK